MHRTMSLEGDLTHLNNSLGNNKTGRMNTLQANLAIDFSQVLLNLN